MNKNIIWLIPVVLVGAIVAFVLWTPDRTGEQRVDVREGWETYQNTVFGFQIQHPLEATIAQEGSSYIKFTYLGGPQPIGEITDGFTVTVGTHAKPLDQDLWDFAQSEYEEQLRVGTSVQAPEATDLYGTEAYVYRVETLGEVTVYVVSASDDGRAHTISHNIADPRDQNYAGMVEDMLRTFETIQTQQDPVDDTQPPQVETVSLAMLHVGDDGEGERYGCDFLVFVERDIVPTTAPLTAAMQELFSIATTSVDGYYNFIANTNDTLQFDRATVEDGTAHIYLTGELSGLSGVCDDPRASIQIEQTALQFATVDDVQLYLNGEPTDLTPSQR
jgi:hypothetical protein